MIDFVLNFWLLMCAQVTSVLEVSCGDSSHDLPGRGSLCQADDGFGILRLLLNMTEAGEVDPAAYCCIGFNEEV